MASHCLQSRTGKHRPRARLRQGLAAQHLHPVNLLHILEHPICGPLKGTDTPTWLLVTLGFSFLSYPEDPSVPSPQR